MKSIRMVIGAVTIVGLIAILVGSGFAQTPTPDANQFNGPCFATSGALVAASGCTHDFRSGATLNVGSGGTLNIGTGATVTWGGVTTSGPLRYGTATGVITGTTIAHGLGVTPTTIMLTAGQPVSTTPIVITANTISITVGFVTGTNPLSMTVYWLAGK